MNSLIRIFSGAALLVALALLTQTGCNQKKPGGKPEAKEEHDHPTAGPHGGVFAEWEPYHAEMIVDAGKKQVTVYILDDTVKAAPKIDASKITKVILTFLDAKPPEQVELKHSPEASNDKGIAFVGTHDKFAKPDGLNVDIRGRVEDKPYNDKVVYKTPSKTALLFLEPGGAYTLADIKANGNVTPTVKFEGKKFMHGEEAPLKVGDKICPISKSKANPECAWVINGERYEFCCQPCIVQFVRTAHEAPAKVKKPNEYEHKGS